VTDGQTDGQNYYYQDRASIAASRGKNMCTLPEYCIYATLWKWNISFHTFIMYS